MRVRWGAASLMATMALVLAGCGASAPVRVAPQSLSGIRIVAIVKVPEPREYTVINKGSLAAAFGAVGGAAIGAEANKNKKGMIGALARTGFSFADALTADLQAALRARGVETSVITPAREAPHKLLNDYRAVMPAGADAVLDVATMDAGYATQHWMTSSFWRPEARVEAALYSRASAAVAYDETFMYGYHNPFMPATELEAPAAYRFPDVAAMESASDDQIIGGLKDASKAIAGAVAARFAP